MRTLLLALLPCLIAADWSQFNATPQTNLVAVRSQVTARMSPGGGIETFSVTAHTLSRLQRNAQNTFWDWARPALHHAAAVAVRCSHGQAGSGILVATQSQGRFILVTNSHVVCEDLGNHRVGPAVRTIQATTSRGQDITGSLISATQPIFSGGEDVALYAVAGSGLLGVPIYSGTPPVGAPVEVLAFGGPSYGTFRPYVGPLVASTSPIAVGAASISGDSGSGILYQGALIGVNYGTDVEVQQAAGRAAGEPIPLCYPASSGASPAFLAAYLNQQCGPLGCPPQIFGGPPQGGGQGQFPGDDQFYPPAGWENQPVQPPPQVSQPVQPQQPIPLTPPANCKPCDCGDLAEKIMDKLGEVAVVGPKGEQGQKGDTGPQGPVGPAGEVERSHIEEIIAAIKADPDMKGPQGERGERGPAGKDAEIDLDKLAAMVIAKLPPIEVESYSKEGKLLDSEKYPYPGPIKIRYRSSEK